MRIHPIMAVPIDDPKVWLVVISPDAVLCFSSGVVLSEMSTPSEMTNPNPSPKTVNPGAMSMKCVFNQNWYLSKNVDPIANMNPIIIIIL